MDNNSRLVGLISFQVNECPEEITEVQAAYALGVLEARSDVTANLDDMDEEVADAYEAGRLKGFALIGRE
jgi:hypothetical protein